MLAPVSIVSKLQICFAFILLNGFSQYLTFFFKESPLPWLPSSVAPGNAQLFASSLFSLPVILLALSTYTCSHTFFHVQTKQCNFLSCPVQRPLHQLSYSQKRLWIFLLSSVSYVKHATLFKVTLLCQFIYRTFIFHSLPSFLSRSWKLVWIIL